MTDSLLSAIESEIRGAVANGAYDQAMLLISSYSKQLESELRNGPVEADQLRRELFRTNEFLDWIFRTVSAARSHDAAQLTGLVSTQRYRREKAAPLHSWQLEG